MREICVTQDILFWYSKHCHQVFYEFSDCRSLSVRESWPDDLDPDRVIVESDYIAPVRLSSVPENLLWITEFVGRSISVHEKVSRYITICLTEEHLDIALESSLGSTCMMHDDILVGVHQRS
jgi:hypothetical protein